MHFGPVRILRRCKRYGLHGQRNLPNMSTVQPQLCILWSSQCLHYSNISRRPLGSMRTFISNRDYPTSWLSERFCLVPATCSSVNRGCATLAFVNTNSNVCIDKVSSRKSNFCNIPRKNKNNLLGCCILFLVPTLLQVKPPKVSYNQREGISWMVMITIITA